MSDAAAPVVTAPVTDTAPVADGGSAAAVVETSNPEAAIANSGAPASNKIKLGGREFDPAELEAILAGKEDIASQLREIAKHKAEREVTDAELKDPKKFRAYLKKYGHDETKFAEDLLLEAIEQEGKTPEQLELEQYRAEKAAREKSDADAKEAEEKKAQETELAQLRTVHEKQYIDALTKHNLPRTTQSLLEMTKLIQIGLDAGYEVTPDHAAQVYRARAIESNKSLYEEMSVDELETVLPEKAIKALVKKYQDSLRTQVAAAPDSKEVRAKRVQPTEKKRTLDDLLKDLGV